MCSVDDRTTDFKELAHTLKMHGSRHMNIYIYILI
jgi:hypothetical protein